MTFANDDVNRMTWEEFETTIDHLIEQVHDFFSQRGEKIDVISPLLRTGGIVGSIIAIRMRVLPLLPMQFKYSYNPTHIDQMISVPDLLVDVPEDMRILLCEGNTSTGSSAQSAAKAIKEKYPKSKIYLATLVKVFGCPERLEGIEHVFHGVMSDENFQATQEQQEELALRTGIPVFPWERAEDELRDINAL